MSVPFSFGHVINSCSLRSFSVFFFSLVFCESVVEFLIKQFFSSGLLNINNYGYSSLDRIIVEIICQTQKRMFHQDTQTSKNG